MKNLLIIVALIFSSISMAEYKPRATDEILVMRDGKVIGRMSRATHKVVKLESEADLKKKEQTLAEMKKQVNKFVQKVTEGARYKEQHNSVIIHGGVGQDGMRLEHANGTYTVEEKTRPVVGGTYCYTTNTVGACATGLSNKTGLIGIKKDF